jgi:hypothetical protein
MVTQKDKYRARIDSLRKTGLSVLKISKKLGIGRGVVNSVIYYDKTKTVKRSAKKAVKKGSPKQVVGSN